jgi:acetoin utilization deacetylase AcuC-like enzyme
MLPKLRDFEPDFIVISAGFDAHRLDPLANLNLSEEDFRWATLRIMEVADLRSAGRVISGSKAVMPLRVWLSQSQRTSQH